MAVPGVGVGVEDSSRPSKARPPPETSTSIVTRRLVVLAFWGVVVLLGLPHWLWTTSIHRAELPLASMNSWADGTACQLRYPIHVGLRSSDLTAADLNTVSRRVGDALAQEFEHLLLTFKVAPAEQSGAPAALRSRSEALTINLNAAKVDSAVSDEPTVTLDSWATLIDVHYDNRGPHYLDQLADSLTQTIASLFYDELTSLSYLLRNTPFAPEVDMSLSEEQAGNLERRITRAFKYSPTYHLTFSLFTPGFSPTSWEIESALDQYIRPLLSLLSSTSSFTVDSQVQLYASFTPSISTPRYDAADSHWKLQYEDLSGFINAAEWPLSPSIGPGPTINFVLYVPSPSTSPLVVNGSGSTNWIIPQWGGVQIHNQTSSDTLSLRVQNLEQDMLVFADQLASLVGLPPSPPSLALRLASLTRQRATSAIISASSTLGALSRLTLKLTSISIPNSVAQSVDETISRLDGACAHLREGQFQLALEDARMAEAEAEKAFFEPSMVGQVYFPEEHKVAVYVPLLGPIAVPMIMALIKEIKAWKNAKIKVT